MHIPSDNVTNNNSRSYNYRFPGIYHRIPHSYRHFRTLDFDHGYRHCIHPRKPVQFRVRRYLISTAALWGSINTAQHSTTPPSPALLPISILFSTRPRYILCCVHQTLEETCGSKSTSERSGMYEYCYCYCYSVIISTGLYIARCWL